MEIIENRHVFIFISAERRSHDPWKTYNSIPEIKKTNDEHNRLVGKTRRWNSDLAKQMGATRTLLSRSLEADSTIGYNRNRNLCRRVQIHLKKHQGISKKQLAAR